MKYNFSCRSQNENRHSDEVKTREEKLEGLSNQLDEANKQITSLKQDLETKSNQVTSYLIEIKDLSHEKNQLNEKITER